MPEIHWTGMFAARPDILLLLAAALTIDGLLPDMPWFFQKIPHPVSMIRRLTGFFDRKLNRERRNEQERLVRGALVVVFVLLLAVAVGWVLDRLLSTLRFGWAAEGAILIMLIAQRGVFDRTKAVRQALARNRLRNARAELRVLVGRDTGGMDTYGVARAAVESCADTLFKNVVGPAFWYVLLGLPGLFLYVSITSMDRQIGYRSPRHAAFGFAAARLDDAVGLIPARLSAILLCFAAIFTPTASPWAALQTAWRDARKHRSFNAGWPEAAIAGALDLSLAGPRSYGGRKSSDPWIGAGRARVLAKDIGRARFLYAAACILHLGMIMALAWIMGVV